MEIVLYCFGYDYKRIIWWLIELPILSGFWKIFSLLFWQVKWSCVSTYLTTFTVIGRTFIDILTLVCSYNTTTIDMVLMYMVVETKQQKTQKHEKIEKTLNFNEGSGDL